MKEFNVNLQCEFPNDYNLDDVISFFRQLSNPDLILTIKHVHAFDMDSRRGKGGNVAWPNIADNKDDN